MSMKNQLLKLFLIFICIFLNVNSNAQNTDNYESIFGDTETYWDYYVNEFDNNVGNEFFNRIYYTENETVYDEHNEQTYKKVKGGWIDPETNEFVDYFLQDVYWLREDLESGKVWVVTFLDSEVADEKLVMDMSLEVGDTFAWERMAETSTLNVIDVYYEDDKKHIVLDYVWDLSPNEDPYPNLNLMFIEGVGPTYDFYDYFWMSFLSCSKKDSNGQVYQNTIENLDDLCTLSNLSSEDFRSEFSFEIYPNPAKNKLFIKSPNQNNLNLEIFNLEGKSVAQHQLKNKREVNISNLNSGIYLVKIKAENGATSTQKLIVK